MCGLNRASQLMRLGIGDFTIGHAILKVVSSKVIKREKTCSNNQHVFIPFAFATFGFQALKAVDLLHRVQRVMHNNVMTPMSMNVVFMTIDFVIQKGKAT